MGNGPIPLYLFLFPMNDVEGVFFISLIPNICCPGRRHSSTIIENMLLEVNFFEYILYNIRGVITVAIT